MSIEEAYNDFYHAIVMQAVDDWRRLCNGKKVGASFEALRSFFNSDWCAALCGELNPSIILTRLEAERMAPPRKKRRRKSNG